MSKRERSDRFTLTIIYSVIVFFVQFASICVAGLVVYISVKAGLIINEETFGGGKIILFMISVSLAIGVFLTLVSSKISLSPVNKLIKMMNRLAAGDFSARLKFNGTFAKTAIAEDVSDGFNKMAEELQNNAILRADFINNFSHEFKTPIVSIAGFAKLLKKGNLSEEEKREYLNIIEEESLRLSEMATNVLHMTEVENQMILTDIKEFNVSEQLRSCILLLERKWDEKELSFNLDIGEITVSASEELLKQVWINLLDNAIKFSPRGSVIDVRAQENEKDIWVEVINFGVEISKEHQKRIFDKFYQADESHSAKGNGIGLAIVKRVTDLHKGEVSLWSENGKTSFRVTLHKGK